MGKFLMACAMIILVMFPIVQFTLNQLNHNHTTRSMEIVHTHVQKARTDGYFTATNISSLKQEIATLMRISPNEIIVNVTTTPKYRFDTFDQREMIDYDIQIPIKRIMAMGNIFGFADSQNSTMYPIKGSAPSEVLAP